MEQKSLKCNINGYLIYGRENMDSYKVRFQKHLNKLTKSEEKVGRYVLNNMGNVVHMTVKLLSNETNVGETTVLRFCNKIGYKNFSDFKLSLSKDLFELESIKNTNEMGQFESYIYKSMFNIKNTIEQTYKQLDFEVIQKVAELLKIAKRIIFIGSSASGLTSEYAQNKFIKIGKTIEYYSDNHMELMNCSTASSNDVIVAISSSGLTKDTVNAAAVAKSSNAKIITITNSEKNPLTKYADHCIYTVGKEILLQGGSIESKVSQDFIIDTLYQAMLFIDEGHFKRALEKSSKSIIDKMY